MKTLLLLSLALLLLFSLPQPATGEGRCCLTSAWSYATGISEDTFYAESPQYQSTGCPSSWGASVVAAKHGYTVETAERWQWNYAVWWAQRGGLIIYAMPLWPASYTGPEGIMHAHFCTAYDTSAPDYGRFWCYDICNVQGRWINAQQMRDTWSGWATGVFPPKENR
jgi:hypothetical protein